MYFRNSDIAGKRIMLEVRLFNKTELVYNKWIEKIMKTQLSIEKKS